MNGTDISDLLSHTINIPEIKFAVNWALQAKRNAEQLYLMTKSHDDRLSINALWCLSHLPKSETRWLQTKQNEFIDRLIDETHPSKKRILLKLLRDQSYEKGTIRTDFLDYCLSKINSECEPYAVRAFCIYCGFKICRFHRELIAELEEHLDMLSTHDLQPGLRCALRTTRANIKRLHFNDISNDNEY